MSSILLSSERSQGMESTVSDSASEPRISDRSVILLDNLTNILAALPDSTKKIRDKRKKVTRAREKIETTKVDQVEKFRNLGSKAEKTQKLLEEISQGGEASRHKSKRDTSSSCSKEDHLSSERVFAQFMQEYTKKELERVEKHELDEGLGELRGFIQELGFDDLDSRRYSEEDIADLLSPDRRHDSSARKADATMVSAVLQYK